MKLSEQIKEAQTIIEGMESKGITDQDMKAIAVIISGVVESSIRSGAISALQEKALSGMAEQPVIIKGKTSPAVTMLFKGDGDSGPISVGKNKGKPN